MSIIIVNKYFKSTEFEMSLKDKSLRQKRCGGRHDVGVEINENLTRGSRHSRRRLVLESGNNRLRTKYSITYADCNS